MKNFFVSLTFLLHLAANGQSFNKAKLDVFFNALEQHNKFMGSVAVAKDGKIIYVKTIGFADVENKIRADERTKYRIGSISKTFTAVLILKAWEEQKLNLDQPIDKWFTRFPNGNKITIRHLLYHRSGIGNFTNAKQYTSYYTSPQSKDQMISHIINSGIEFEPGSKTQYSNSNYVLLTYILEDVYGKSYAELVREYITLPAGLQNTYVFDRIDVEENECKSYHYKGSWVEAPQTHFSVALGAGGLVSTSIDLVQFAGALFNGKLLSDESLAEMKTLKNGYGMGIFPIPFYYHIGFGHTGGIDGFNAVFAYFPGSKVSYALVSNGANYNTNDISIAVLSAVFDKPYEIPEFSSYKLSSEDLDVYLGVYASEQIDLKITVTKNAHTLIVQGSGQSAFAIEPVAKDTFKSDMVKATFHFDPSNKTLTLIQGGKKMIFTKEE